MDVLQVTAVIITLTALFSYLNARLLKLPSTIGLMLISMASSLALLLLGSYVPDFQARAVALVSSGHALRLSPSSCVLVVSRRGRWAGRCTSARPRTRPCARR